MLTDAGEFGEVGEGNGGLAHLLLVLVVAAELTEPERDRGDGVMDHALALRGLLSELVLPRRDADLEVDCGSIAALRGVRFVRGV